MIKRILIIMIVIYLMVFGLIFGPEIFKGDPIRFDTSDLWITILSFLFSLWFVFILAHRIDYNLDEWCGNAFKFCKAVVTNFFHLIMLVFFVLLVLESLGFKNGVSTDRIYQLLWLTSWMVFFGFVKLLHIHDDLRELRNKT